MYSCNSTQFFETGQYFVHGLVINYHVVVCHIQFERRDSFRHNLLQFTADVLVPVGKSQVERIIAGRLPVRFSMPVVQSLGQRFTLILCRKIYDAGGSSRNLCLRSGVKFVCRYGVADFQGHMGMCINKSREDVFSPDVLKLSVPEFQIFTDCQNLFALYQDVKFFQPFAAYNDSAFK